MVAGGWLVVVVVVVVVVAVVVVQLKVLPASIHKDIFHQEETSCFLGGGGGFLQKTPMR